MIVDDVTPVRPLAVNSMVREPTVPVIARLENADVPPASVDTVSVPPNVPPPEAMAAVTPVPPRLTGLPASSWSCTTGCCGKGTSFATVADGSVVSASFVAVPAESAIAVAVSGTSVPDVNASR